MSPEQMSRASDDELLNQFADLATDSEKFRERGGLMLGGVIEASRAFGELASLDPMRVVPLLSRLEPAQDERYAAEAIGKLLRSDDIGAAGPQLVHDLSTKGFKSSEFRWHAANGLAEWAEKHKGLDDSTCVLLESWLMPDDGHSTGEHSESATDAEKRGSVLLESGIFMLPHGNFPVLNALCLGLMRREPDEPDQWLAVLERHIDSPEDPEVWGALAYRGLLLLREANVARTSELITKLVEPNRGVFRQQCFALFIARAHWWLPGTVLDAYLEACIADSSLRSALAASEIAALVHFVGSGVST